MLDGVNLKGLGGILRMQRTGQVDQINPNIPAGIAGLQPDTVEISSIGRLLGSVEQMDEATAADLHDFMSIMHQALQSGSFDAYTIADLASENLTSFARDQGIDLAEVAGEHADLARMQSGMPPADRIAQTLIDNWDTDSDNLLNSDEAPISERLFQKLDKNEDDQLDKNELAELLSRADSSSQTGQKPQKNAASDDKATSEMITAEFDTTGDGQVDTQEVTTYGQNGQVESVTTQPV